MFEVVRVPHVGTNDIQARLVRWHVKPGSPVKASDCICDLETTKATIEISAPVDGYIHPFVEAGVMVQIDQVLAAMTDSADAPPPPAAANQGPLVSMKASQLIKEHGLSVEDFPAAANISSDDVLALVASRTARAGDDRLNDFKGGPDAVAIFGTGSLGTMSYDTLRAKGDLDCVAFIDASPRFAEMCGLPVFHSRWLPQLRTAGLKHLHLAFYRGEGEAAAMSAADDIGFHVVNAIHPTAVVSATASLGRNVLLGPLTIVGPEAVVGDRCRILNGASLAHHSRLGHGSWLTDGSRVAGNVTIGENTLLGLNATVNLRLSIGSNVVVTSGAHVYESVPDNSIVRTNGATVPR
jgi:UDP-perosamine 4-acetyltransferase